MATTISNLLHYGTKSLAAAAQYGTLSFLFGIGDPLSLAIGGSAARVSRVAIFEFFSTATLHFLPTDLRKCVDEIIRTDGFQTQPQCWIDMSHQHYALTGLICAAMATIPVASYFIGKAMSNKFCGEQNGMKATDYLKAATIMVLTSSLIGMAAQK